MVELVTQKPKSINGDSALKALTTFMAGIILTILTMWLTSQRNIATKDDVRASQQQTSEQISSVEAQMAARDAADSVRDNEIVNMRIGVAKLCDHEHITCPQ